MCAYGYNSIDLVEIRIFISAVRSVHRSGHPVTQTRTVLPYHDGCHPVLQVDAPVRAHFRQ